MSSKLNNFELNFVVDRNGEVCSFSSSAAGRSYGACREDADAKNATQKAVYKRVCTLNEQKFGLNRLIELYNLLKSNDNYHWEEKYSRANITKKYIQVYDSTTGQIIRAIP
jgi:uncharacterized FlaG/YvyC family protein